MAMNKILLIEDDCSVAQCTARMLRSMGYEVTIAGCGESGMHSLRNQSDRASLALVDYTLPNANGIEVSERIRSEFPHVHLVLMSGFSRTEFESALTEHGFIGFLQKPFQRDDLKRIVEKSPLNSLHSAN